MWWESRQGTDEKNVRMVLKKKKKEDIMGKVLLIGLVRGNQPPVAVLVQKHVHILEKWCSLGDAGKV